MITRGKRGVPLMGLLPEGRRKRVAKKRKTKKNKAPQLQQPQVKETQDITEEGDSLALTRSNAIISPPRTNVIDGDKWGRIGEVVRAEQGELPQATVAQTTEPQPSTLEDIRDDAITESQGEAPQAPQGEALTLQQFVETVEVMERKSFFQRGLFVIVVQNLLPPTLYEEALQNVQRYFGNFLVKGEKHKEVLHIENSWRCILKQYNVLVRRNVLPKRELVRESVTYTHRTMLKGKKTDYETKSWLFLSAETYKGLYETMTNLNKTTSEEGLEILVMF